MNKRQVVILMGSDSDASVMQAAADVLTKFGVGYIMTVASAHRSPDRVKRLIDEAHADGVGVVIVGAGAAAHLAGGIAAPPGVPVATMAIGKAGATNAAVLAVQILATGDSALVDKLTEYKASLVAKVEKAAAKVES